MEDLAGLDGSLLVGVKDQEALEHEVFEEAEAHLRSAEQAQDAKLLTESEQKVKSLRHKLEQLRTNARTATLNERAHYNRLVMGVVDEIDQWEATAKDIRARLQQRLPAPSGKPAAQRPELMQEKMRRMGIVVDPLVQERATKAAHIQTSDAARRPSFRPQKRTLSDLSEEEEEEAATAATQQQNDDTSPRANDHLGQDASSGTSPSKRHQSYTLDDVYVDDGDEHHYRQRLSAYLRRLKASQREELGEEEEKREEEEEMDAKEMDTVVHIPHPEFGALDKVLNVRDNRGQTLCLPGEIATRLFPYQIDAVRWMFGLHTQHCGGLLGDEMGLGKTIQIIAFLASLFYSTPSATCFSVPEPPLHSPNASPHWAGPVLIVCPGTVMKQWVQEFHTWYPAFRVAILHASGSSPSSAAQLVTRIQEEGHVLITTYAGVQQHQDLLLSSPWHYLILDEGHKIRNPDAKITQTVKLFTTPHRLIMTGTPMQNNLNELWSMYDFVFPGKLGTLPLFQSQFAIPINMGGYANASAVQVQTAFKCTVVLRDLISPYLLRRMKMDVIAQTMPPKSEQVLFCKLTSIQRKIYEEFLNSKDLEAILEGKRQILYGVDILRKISNHPDLLLRKELLEEDGQLGTKYGQWRKSGKMKVVKALLALWQRQGHRVLLFAQTRQMLDILERLIKDENYVYRRMDGATPIKFRSSLVDEFNATSDIFVLLLTTKVGGLGINLTGANRVIIFDPDWNPSTDIQARERAWRLGQKKDVIIYRLMTAGTIEEKIYHRQIFKQFLSNKILKDPRQKRFFKSRDLRDLFTLSIPEDDTTETAEIFEDSRIDMKQLQGADPEREPAAIPEVAFSEAYQPERDAADAAEPTGTAGQQKTLDDLLEITGVHSALQHDKIMDLQRPERILIDREAEKIARKALHTLIAHQNSGRSTPQSISGAVTPTGSRVSPGEKARAPGAALIGKPSASSALLEKMRQRKELTALPSTRVASLESSRGTNSPPAEDDLGMSLLPQVLRILRESPEYRATTARILSAASVRLNDTSQVAIVRALLKEVATWQKPVATNADGTGEKPRREEGTWQLKEAFYPSRA